MMQNMAGVNVNAFAPRWWMIVIRGIAAILFGVLTFALPRIGLLTLVTLWGAYVLVDGFFAVMAAGRAGRAGFSWGWMLFEGLVSIAAGVVAFLWPGITALVLLFVIAVRAVIIGIAEIAEAIWLRREIRNEWLLGLSGLLSIVFGALLFWSPAAGALAVLWLIGAYAIVFGVLLVALGLRLHHWMRRRERQFPMGGAPRPA
jgi:uncharacterized membrane protein HdeD (DUF308 family)